MAHFRVRRFEAWQGASAAHADNVVELYCGAYCSARALLALSKHAGKEFSKKSKTANCELLLDLRGAQVKRQEK